MGLCTRFRCLGWTFREGLSRYESWWDVNVDDGALALMRDDNIFNTLGLPVGPNTWLFNFFSLVYHFHACGPEKQEEYKLLSLPSAPFLGQLSRSPLHQLGQYNPVHGHQPRCQVLLPLFQVLMRPQQAVDVHAAIPGLPYPRFCAWREIAGRG
jgi:hypothetical protein